MKKCFNIKAHHKPYSKVIVIFKGTNTIHLNLLHILFTFYKSIIIISSHVIKQHEESKATVWPPRNQKK